LSFIALFSIVLIKRVLKGEKQGETVR